MKKNMKKNIYYTFITELLCNILFHYGLLQDIKYHCLCYIVGPFCLSIWGPLFFRISLSRYTAFSPFCFSHSRILSSFTSTWSLHHGGNNQLAAILYEVFFCPGYLEAAIIFNWASGTIIQYRVLQCILAMFKLLLSIKNSRGCKVRI